MKKYLLVAMLVCVGVSSFAQKKDDDEKHKFRTDRMFLGGSVGLGLGGGTFGVGANPEIGYSITDWFDAGFSVNFNYTSITAESNGGFRQRTTNWGGGTFLRLYPIKELFIQVLPEYNWVTTKLKDMRVDGTGEEFKISQSAPSLLLGAGYCSRDVGSSNFYTVIMFDAGTNTNSPYIGYYGSKYPILRTGFNFYLGRGQKRR